MINAILICYGFVLKPSSRPVMKDSRVETIEVPREEYKKLLEEGWKKTYRFHIFLKNLVNRYFTLNLTLLKINC